MLNNCKAWLFLDAQQNYNLVILYKYSKQRLKCFSRTVQNAALASFILIVAYAVVLRPSGQPFCTAWSFSTCSKETNKSQMTWIQRRAHCNRARNRATCSFSKGLKKDNPAFWIGPSSRTQIGNPLIQFIHTP